VTERPFPAADHLTIRHAYLAAATSAAALLGDPAVAASWHAPSALEHYDVAGLAGHLAGQIFYIRRVLDAPPPAEEPVSILEYYARVPWIDAGPDDDAHVNIRAGSIANAVDGPAALAARAEAAVDDLRQALPAAPPERLVRLPIWDGYSLRLDDFVVSRMMELAVHSDDLAASAGITAPALPPVVIDIVVDLLSRLAVRRHGPSAVLRALTRQERAPATIAAF
jgi:hypothetical protein